MNNYEKLSAFVRELNKPPATMIESDEDKIAIAYCFDTPNAVMYDHQYYAGGAACRIAFNRNHRELYSMLLMFCAENNMTIISTTPATLETIVLVRVELF